MQNPPRPDDPIYYNMNASSPLIQQQTSWNSATPSPQAYNNHYHHQHPQSTNHQQSLQNGQHGQNAAAGGLNGHTNPSYQHSTPNLTDVPDIDEYITHRPPSVRSSYSNFHGTRPLSYNPNGTAAAANQENLFAGLAQQSHHQAAQNHHQQQYYQQAQQTKPLAIPQVPNKRVQRDRFLSNGPPAYNLQNFNHTPPDSETTM